MFCARNDNVPTYIFWKFSPPRVFQPHVYLDHQSILLGMLGEGRHQYWRGAFMEVEECEILQDTGGKETYDTGEQLTQLYT